jgi:hypothetical protein
MKNKKTQFLNASTAREISEKNYNKAIDEFLEKTLFDLAKEIKGKAEKGKYNLTFYWDMDIVRLDNDEDMTTFLSMVKETLVDYGYNVLYITNLSVYIEW